MGTRVELNTLSDLKEYYVLDRNIIDSLISLVDMGENRDQKTSALGVVFRISKKL